MQLKVETTVIFKLPEESEKAQKFKDENPEFKQVGLCTVAVIFKKVSEFNGQ